MINGESPEGAGQGAGSYRTSSGIPEGKKPAVKAKLEQIFGASNVTDVAHNLFTYSYDATESPPHMPDFVVLVENVDQVVEVVKYANQERIPLVPYITGNNIGGLTIPERGGVVLDFGKKMNRILYVHVGHQYALLEPGVTFGQLNQYLKDNHPDLRYCYPFAPPWSGVVGNAILSGMNNMSCAKGSMGDWINGLEVVTYDGSVTRIGTCFLTPEYRPDNWHSRYPMPDLMGLFINWQGMTGIVTKCAVQLWPRKPIETALLAISDGAEETAALMREVGRTGLVDDISTVSVEVAKMALKMPTPRKFDFEPDFAHLIPISGYNRKHLEVKMEIVLQRVQHLREKFGEKFYVTDFDTFAAFMGDGVRVFYDLPSVITPLVEYSGLTWVGTYAPPDNLGILIEEADAKFHEYGVPSFIYMKIMKANHYAIFRPIIRYKKDTEEERTHQLCSELLEIALKHGCIPYKTPVWMTERLREQVDPNWIRLFERVKRVMDPNGVFNPGRWGI
ncbi:MAG: FAD-binding oxidoreductase [Promethearchaeota archaeon]